MSTRSLVVTLAVGILAASSAGSASPKVELVEGKYSVEVRAGSRLLTAFRHTPDPDKPLLAAGVLQTKPVLHPILSPSGVPLTRGYPFETIAGEDVDHPHHQGLFFTVDGVGPDRDVFWNNGRDPLPAIRHVKVLRKQEDSDRSTLVTLAQWIGKSGKTLLDEEREMVFAVPAADHWQMDFAITLTAVDQEIDFENTKEGLFAVRVAQWLTERGTGRYLNSAGEEGEEGVWGKRANWVRLQGQKDGQTLGLAILEHPESVNAPTYWHARGYGCFSANPLGQLDFQKAQRVADPKPFVLKLKPKDHALFRYRVIVYEGGAGRDKVEVWYREYLK